MKPDFDRAIIEMQLAVSEASDRLEIVRQNRRFSNETIDRMQSRVNDKRYVLDLLRQLKEEGRHAAA